MRAYLDNSGFEAAFHPDHPPKSGRPVRVLKVTRAQFDALFPPAGAILPRPGTVYLLTN